MVKKAQPVTMKKKADKRVSVIRLKVKKRRIGHQPHRSGSGVHEDRRTKRNRTRQTQNDKAISEQI